MTDDPKPDLTKSVVGQMLHEELAKLEERQAKRDAEQDAKLARPSRKTIAQRTDDVAALPSKVPVGAWAMAVLFIGIGLWQLTTHPPTGVDFQSGWRIGCLVFGIACVPEVLPYAVKNLRDLVGLVKTFKGNGTSGPAGT